jgi:hypothetical protein
MEGKAPGQGLGARGRKGEVAAVRLPGATPVPPVDHEPKVSVTLRVGPPRESPVATREQRPAQSVGADLVKAREATISTGSYLVAARNGAAPMTPMEDRGGGLGHRGVLIPTAPVRAVGEAGLTSGGAARPSGAGPKGTAATTVVPALLPGAGVALHRPLGPAAPDTKPSTRALVTRPLVTRPLVTVPLVTVALVTRPLVTVALVTVALVTRPLVTVALVTRPLVTVALVTVPPATGPPGTGPAVMALALTDNAERRQKETTVGQKAAADAPGGMLPVT